MGYLWPLGRDIKPGQLFGWGPGGVNPSGGHTGMDFPCPVGTVVRAPGDGVIERAQEFTTTNGSDNAWWLTVGGGITIVLNCGPGKPNFNFAHLSRLAVKRGDKVTKGQIIGYSGNTGRWTTGPHLHFEAVPDGFNIRSNTYGRVNPAIFCNEYYSGENVSAALQPFQRLLGPDAVAYRKQASGNAELIDWFVPGSVYDFKGFVRGDSVNGNNIWFVGLHTGGFAWSGAFTSQSTANLADLTPAAKPAETIAPNERTVGTVVANLRSGAGTNHGLKILESVPDGQLKIDTTYVFKGYVHGELVGGSDIWLVSKSDGYAHIGAFTNRTVDGLPDLTPAAPAPTPEAPAPAPAPVLTYSFNKDLDCVTDVRPAGIGHYAADGLPKKPLKIVIHQFDSTVKAVGIESVISWFQSPDGNTSAHFAVQDENITQIVKLGDRAYHAKAAGNDFVGIETHVGPNGNTAATFASVVKLIVAIQNHYGYRMELVDHRSLNATSCGTNIDLPAYKAAVAAATNTAPTPVETPVVVVPAPTVPGVNNDVEFAKFMYESIGAYLAQKEK